MTQKINKANGGISKYKNTTLQRPSQLPPPAKKFKSTIKEPSKIRTVLDVTDKCDLLGKEDWLTDLHIITALRFIIPMVDLKGLIDPFEFTNNDTLPDHIISIDKFSAFVVHAGNHWLTVRNVNPNCDTDMGSQIYMGCL
jgi:hypothetical protein